MKTQFLLRGCLLLCLVPLTGCLPLTYRSYDGKFGGLGWRLQQTARSNATLHVVMVHGMGDHCPGNGGIFATNLARALKIQPVGAWSETPLPSPLGVVNWLREMNFARETNRLKFHEVTWTPTTYSLKTNAFEKDRRLDRERLWLNRRLKRSIFEQAFGDAVLYLNPQFRPLMQRPILQTITNVAARAGSNDQIVLVGHSLGSKMTFDTVTEYANFAGVRDFAGKTTDIVMLANQISLLSLGMDTNGFPFTPDTQRRPLRSFIQIGHKQRQTYLKAAPETVTINVVAATDPNDLLSYPLRHLDVQEDTPLDDSSFEVNVVNIYSHNAWGIPWLVENPDPAHTKYDENHWLIKKLVRGFTGTKECFPKPVGIEFPCETKKKKHL